MSHFFPVCECSKCLTSASEICYFANRIKINRTPRLHFLLFSKPLPDRFFLNAVDCFLLHFCILPLYFLPMIKNVILIGAGNLATQLGLALSDSGVNIVQVYSRTTESARALAGKVNASFTNDLSAIKEHCDLYIVAVKDDVVTEVASQVNFGNNLVVHTAGSLPMQILAPYSEKYGVFYPFQTFSKNKKVDFSKVPVCLEANTPENMKNLEGVARKISYKITPLNSDQRFVLHIAAVFSCNFVNHLYTLSEKLLNENNINFDLLYPLIQETTEKAMKLSPFEAQTGPSARNDQEIIRKHQKLLDGKPDFQEIYRLISESIHQTHHL